jgi:dinuclear metal center YbgI/SA1388 family protein
MVNRDAIISFLEKYFGGDLLARAVYKDELANGVQVIGGENVEKVTLGVDTDEEFLKKTLELGSNFCITHHGLDFRVYKNRLPISTQKRLKLIFNHQITAMGFHFALDTHPVIGNNATLISSLGATKKQPFFEDWGYTATFEKPQNIEVLKERCEEIINHSVHAIKSGPKEIRTIGVCSGAAKPYAQHVAEMEEKGVELFISGESSESIPARMKESSINYFICGHYATEVFGVQELGKVIKSHFKEKLMVEFIDIPNPI